MRTACLTSMKLTINNTLLEFSLSFIQVGRSSVLNRGLARSASPWLDLNADCLLMQICDLRNLAMALVEKCTMDPGIDPYNGEEGQPQNVEPVFSVSLVQ